MSIFRKDHCCPWWLVYTFDNRLRRIFQKPEEIVGPYLREGMSVLDTGCGIGFLSVYMSGAVGKSGRVIAVDLQQEMLDGLHRRAVRHGVPDNIKLHLCKADDLMLTDKVDFAVAMWMVHEVPDRKKYLGQVCDAMNPGSKFLIIEPKIHVKKRSLDKTIGLAGEVGLSVCEYPKIGLSLAVLLEKK